MVIKNTKYRHKNGLKHGVLVTLFYAKSHYLKGIGVFFAIKLNSFDTITFKNHERLTMQSLSLLNQLGAKIDELIEKIKKQEEELNALRQANTTLNAQNEEKDIQIAILYDELSAKDKGIQGLYDKISDLLS